MFQSLSWSYLSFLWTNCIDCHIIVKFRSWLSCLSVIQSQCYQVMMSNCHEVLCLCHFIRSSVCLQYSTKYFWTHKIISSSPHCLRTSFRIRCHNPWLYICVSWSTSWGKIFLHSWDGPRCSSPWSSILCRRRRSKMTRRTRQILGNQSSHQFWDHLQEEYPHPHSRPSSWGCILQDCRHPCTLTLSWSCSCSQHIQCTWMFHTVQRWHCRTTVP